MEIPLSPRGRGLGRGGCSCVCNLITANAGTHPQPNLPPVTDRRIKDANGYPVCAAIDQGLRLLIDNRILYCYDCNPSGVAGSIKLISGKQQQQVSIGRENFFVARGQRFGGGD